tara:strand:- start:14340 stop:16088 length:1749 start_codon:yes stop_codon:yes gene_type:complete
MPNDDIKQQSLFWGTSGPQDAEIAVVGESWGVNEKTKKLPFVGNTGKLWDGILAEILNVPRDKVFHTNVVSEHPYKNDMKKFFYSTKEARGNNNPPLRGLYPHPFVHDHLSRLYAQLKKVNPKIIIALGNYALWALTEDSFRVGNKEGFKVPEGIANWGGSQLRTPFIHNTPLLPTFHPAATFETKPWLYMIKHDLKARVPLALEDKWDAPERKLRVQPSLADVMLFLQSIKDEQLLSTDIETWRGHIACIALATSATNAICIPFFAGGTHYWSEEEEILIIKALNKALLRSRIIGQNFLFDSQYIASDFFVRVDAYIDTMLIHHLLFPGGGNDNPVMGVTQKRLGNLSRLYCDHHVYWKEDGKDWDEKNFTPTNLWTYNCVDVVRTFEIAEVLLSLVKEFALEDQFKFQMRQAKMALNMMLRGIRVDLDRRTAVAKELEEYIAEYAKTIDALVPEDVYPRKPKAKPWYQSAPQIMEVIYDVLGVKPVLNRKTKRPTLSAQAYNTVKNREPIVAPILEHIERFRSLRVFKSTFTESELDSDKRMRTGFNPGGTESFRWNSRENPFGRGGNIQNIPKGEEEDD